MPDGHARGCDASDRDAPPPEMLAAWDREHVWHAFTQMAEYEPLLIERADGCTLYDSAGRTYLDGVSSLWCNVHGHNHPRINAAIREQLDKVAHTTLLGASNSTTVRLARRLVELAPAGLNHVFFASDGSSSVEVALKMAFQYWQQRQDPRPAKTKYAALSDAYHGDTLGSVSVGGVARFHAMFRPLLFDCLRVPAPVTYRTSVKLPPEQLAAHYLQPVEQLLAERHQEIAALVVEPLVQAAAGMLVHPPGYLHGLRELTRRYDVLLIADEVAVGFGRTGRLFACEHEDVAPDFLCLGKGLTGGYLPMAATMATSDVWNAFLGPADAGRQFFHGHTFSGNPLAAAAALASLEVFEDEQVLAVVTKRSEQLSQRLERIAGHRHVGDVRQRGLLAGIELVRNRDTAEPFPWNEQRGREVCRHAREKGVLLRPLGDVIVIMPPLAISPAELDQISDAVEYGIERATQPR
ncbi:MAG TPA: adenosylmethionine--8-amino-7-oxononanoate transaminase [Pirellulales bacterium]|nr:adenosylmethionine--8-amino-7-oxononanoate transaminase [Pirellulales bacterium]